MSTTERALSARWLVTLVAASGFLGGCAASDEPNITEGVVVAPFEQLTESYDDLASFVKDTPVVVTGKVVAVDEQAYEVMPDPDSEGAFEGEGPDIYGTITFEIIDAYKGSVKSADKLTVVYESGKWNAPDKKLRIAYKHGNMASLHTDRGGLRTPGELGGKTFLLFAGPRAGDDISAEGFHLISLATVDATGKLKFDQAEPFSRPSASTLDDIVQALE